MGSLAIVDLPAINGAKRLSCNHLLLIAAFEMPTIESIAPPKERANYQIQGNREVPLFHCNRC
jgi:hypothetical protein